MWDTFVLHNFVFRGVIVSDNGPVETLYQGPTTFVDDLSNMTSGVSDDPPTVDAPAFVPPIENVKSEPTPPSIAALLKNSPNKVVVLCQPGVVRKNKDDLYGEIRTQVVPAGEPFTFEGVIVYGDDLSLSIWSPTDRVTRGSVIFPQNRDKRWWKVVSVEPNMQGWMLNTVISDYQPQFRA